MRAHPVRLLLLLAYVLAAAPLPILAQEGGSDPPKGDRPGGGKEEGGKKRGEVPDPKEPRRLAVGDEVKDLVLDLADEGTWSVPPVREKGAILVFAAEWSKESLEALKSLGDPKGKVASSGAEVLGVLRDADPGKARKIAREQEIPVRLAVDPKRRAYDRFAKSGLPYTVVIDRSGRLAMSSAGFDEEAVAKKLEEGKR